MRLHMKTLLQATALSVFMFVLMAFFMRVNYIDLSVVKTVYLPIWILALVAILFEKHVFAYIFTASAGLGLIAEYIVHLLRENPTMAGAFLNILIIVLGIILGIVVQIAVSKA